MKAGEINIVSINQALIQDNGRHFYDQEVYVSMSTSRTH